MAISQADKALEYMGNAERCLEIARRLPDREARIAEREKAAEWLMRVWSLDAPSVADNHKGRRARQG